MEFGFTSEKGPFNPKLSVCVCVCVCVCSRSEGAGVARGRSVVLSDDASLGGRVQRHDDAVSQLPAAVHGRHPGPCRALVRPPQHRARRLQPADVPRRAISAEIGHRHLVGRLSVGYLSLSPSSSDNAHDLTNE